MSSIAITDTIRTATEMANILYSTQMTYASLGEQVKAFKAQCVKKGMPKNQIIQEMANLITELQGKNQLCSRHCVPVSSYNKRNTIDLGLNSNGFGTKKSLSPLGQKFKQVCNDAVAQGLIAKFISGDVKGEGAMHIEIVQ